MTDLCSYPSFTACPLCDLGYLNAQDGSKDSRGDPRTGPNTLPGLSRGPVSVGVSCFLEGPGQCPGVTFLTFLWLKEQKGSSRFSRVGLHIRAMTSVAKP